jgi:PAS domain S-box-containing protein
MSELKPRSDATEDLLPGGLIEAMPGIFYLYDAGGNFLRWNRDFERVSGYSGEEILAMRPLDFFAEADRELLRQRIAEVFERGESSVEAPFLTKSGETIPYYFTGKRIRVDGADCLVGVGLDISEQKRIEAALAKSEQRYRTTLDSVLEGCQLLDFDWRYLYLNDAASVQNRRPNSELLGQRMPDAWPGIEQTRVFSLLEQCMRERLPFREEVEFAFPDGYSGWFEVHVQPVPEGIFILSIETTVRKRAELDLRELNDELERKVRERTEDLRQALHRAEAADRVKSAFLATMSHELRTPLNSILGFTGILLQRMAGPLTQEQGKQLGMVQTSARHLLELINDVLDISKIEAGQLDVRIAPFDPGSSIAHAVSSVEPLATKKGLSVVFESGELPATLSSDRRRFEQILLNLLNNAIKFTDEGAVTVSAQVNAGEDATKPPVLHVRVADTGTGISPEHLQSLFQPFRQLDSGLGRQHEGTGLGLAICQRLANLLGAHIEVQSAVGEGSQFTLCLPLGRMEQ